MNADDALNLLGRIGSTALGLAGWIAAALVMFWLIGARNRLGRLRSTVASAYAPLDRVLAERAQLVTQLEAIARPHLPLEQATFDALAAAQAEAASAASAVRARPASAIPAAQLGVALTLHGSTLARLMSLLEHDTALRHDAQLAPLLTRWHASEHTLRFTRQAFNVAVQHYNDARDEHPTRWVGRLFGYAPAGEI